MRAAAVPGVVPSPPSLPDQPLLRGGGVRPPLTAAQDSAPPACSSLFLPLMSPAQLAQSKICRQTGLTPSFPKSRPATPGGGPDEALRPHTSRLQHPPAEGSSPAPQTCSYGEISPQEGVGSGVCTELARPQHQGHQASSSLSKFLWSLRFP